MRSVLLALALCGCARAERPISAPDAGRAPLGDVAIAPHGVLFELRGSDFEDARGRGCPLEAIVDEPAAGQSPILRFRCAIYGGP